MLALGISEIWILDVIEEIRDYLEPYYILVTCKKLWSEFQLFFFLGSIFPKISFPSIVALFLLVVKFYNRGHLWQNFFKFFSV